MCIRDRTEVETCIADNKGVKKISKNIFIKKRSSSKKEILFSETQSLPEAIDSSAVDFNVPLSAVKVANNSIVVSKTDEDVYKRQVFS